ncbi:group II intron maturase-specific domain-containing protein [Promicromonospora soli]
MPDGHRNQDDAHDLREQAASALATMSLRLSPEKTLITHIDDGLDFLGWRIQRRRQRGGNKEFVYSYPAKKSLKTITAKVKRICRMSTERPLAALIHQLNPVLRGWCAFFRTGVSSATFNYLREVVWRLVTRWLRRKHHGTTWKTIHRRYGSRSGLPCDGEVKLFNPAAVRTERYRYRGTAIPVPWPSTMATTTT